MTRKEYKHKWYLQNKERILDDRKKYYQENANDIKSRSNNYYHSHPEVLEKQNEYNRLPEVKVHRILRDNSPEIKARNKIVKRHWDYNNIEHIRDYVNNRYSSDINYRLKCIARARMYSLIKGKNKSVHSLVLLGCSVQQWKMHLESTFKVGWNWNNHGIRWEIDHIIPVSLFDLTDIEQQKKCFNYTNTQAMSKEDNRKKSNRT